MAVLEKIRSNAGLVVGVVGLGLFAFVIGDALQSGSTFWGQSELNVLTIEDEQVSIHDYSRRLEELTTLQGNQMTEEQSMMLNNQLSQEYITEYAIFSLARQVGLKVTGDEVYALLHGGQGIQPARAAMQFFSSVGVDINDQEAVNNFITQMSDRSINALPEEQRGQLRMLQSQWLMLQRAIVRDRCQEKLSSLLARTYKVTKLDEELALADGTRTVALVRTTAPLINSEVDPVSKEELQAYYDKHKESYRMPQPITEVSYISMQVTPSSEDYTAAELAASQVVDELRSATTAEDAERVIRSAGSGVPEAYATASELERMGLSAPEVAFAQESELGAVRSSGLIDNHYSILKLMDRTSGVASLQVRYAVLDSAMSQRVDSLRGALTSDAAFEAFVREHSIDPQSASKGGLLEMPTQYGATETDLTELTAVMLKNQTGLAFDKLFAEPVGTIINLGQEGNAILVRAEKPGAVVTKYKVAQVRMPAEFSQRTYDSRLDALTRILHEGGSFDQMATKAEAEGFSVSRGEYVGTSSATLGRIPGSRSIVSWAIKAKEGETTDKVYRFGSDYLAIAQVNSQVPAGYAPIAMVEDGIKVAVGIEKRAEALATSLAGKGLTSLEGYASELDVQVDTLVGVSYLVRGSEDPAFNGKAMKTPLGQLSKPFVAGREVMVVQPVQTDAVNADVATSQSRQQERNVGYQLFSRAFGSLISGLKVEDNRSRFY